MIYKKLDIGKKLRKARMELKLTQEDLALRINKKRSFISRIENNGTNINLKTIQEIVEKGLNGRIKFEIETNI